MEDSCRYAPFSRRVKNLFGLYKTYIERGGSDLLDFPYWMGEVARMVGHFESERDSRGLYERKERDRQEDMLQKAGIITG